MANKKETTPKVVQVARKILDAKSKKDFTFKEAKEVAASAFAQADKQRDQKAKQAKPAKVTRTKRY